MLSSVLEWKIQWNLRLPLMPSTPPWQTSLLARLTQPTRIWTFWILVVISCSVISPYYVSILCLAPSASSTKRVSFFQSQDIMVASTQSAPIKEKHFLGFISYLLLSGNSVATRTWCLSDVVLHSILVL